MYVNSTQVYVNSIQVCVNSTQVYVNSTQVYVNSTQVYVNSIQVCVNPTQARNPDLATSIVVVAEDSENKLFSSSDKKAIFCALMAEDICKELRITPRSLVAELVDRRLGQQVSPSRSFSHPPSNLSLYGGVVMSLPVTHWGLEPSR